MQKFYLSVIIPCFNEEKIIRTTHQRVKKVLVNNSYKHEIIYINDGSKDKTFDILENTAKKDKSVKIINFSRNFGHQAGVAAGLNNCSGDLAIIIDADLQDPPEIFPDMIKLYFKEKCNIVYAVRKKRKDESIFKKLTAKIFYRLLNYLSEVNLPVDTGDFRLIDKKAITAFKSLSEKNKYIRGLFSWIGFKQIPIYYEREARAAGETKYTLSKMLKLAKTAIFYFSKKPLKLSFPLGFASIIIGLLLTAYVFVSKFYFPERTIPGWSSILISIIFFGGIQLFMIGVLGEYIGSIFDEVKNRPEYLISDYINFNKKR